MCYSYQCFRDFFEFIYFISGTFVPILLFYITLKFSKSEKKLQENQYNFKPMFKFEYVYENDRKVQEILTIGNKNDIYLENCSIENQIFITLKPDNSKLETLRKRIKHYYFRTSGNLVYHDKVTISPAENDMNLEHFNKLYQEIIKPDFYANLVLERYIIITYDNEIDKQKKCIYHLNELGFKKVNSIPKPIKHEENLDSISFYDLKSEDLIKEYKELNYLE